eukprot:3939086-Rhodomonas_salina.2
MAVSLWRVEENVLSRGWEDNGRVCGGLRFRAAAATTKSRILKMARSIARKCWGRGLDSRGVLWLVEGRKETTNELPQQMRFIVVYQQLVLGANQIAYFHSHPNPLYCQGREGVLLENNC